MSTIDDPYDSDDPLAPKIERLTPITIPKYREDTPPVATKSSNRKKIGPSQGDTVLLGYLNPNRPDLAQEGGNLVLLRDSPPDSGSRSRSKEREEQDVEEDLDERLAKQMMKEEKEREEREEAEQRIEKQRGTLDLPPREHEPMDKERAMTASKYLNRKLDQSENVDLNPPSIDEEMPDRKPHLEQSKNSQHKDQSIPGPLNIKNINHMWKQSSSTAFPPPLTSIPSKPFGIKKEPPRRHSINSFNGPPSGSPDSPLASSPLRTLLRDAPTAEHRLAPIQSACSPPSVPGFTSPVLNQQLPPAGPILKVADEINSESQLRTRQRQQSMSSISAITAPSPTYTLSSGPSPATYTSPPTSLDSATSPRDWASKLPGSAATSPFYSQFNHPYRRLSQASETFLPLQSASSDSYNTSSDTFRIDTPSSTSIATSSETNGRIGETRPVGMGPPTPLTMTLPNTPSATIALSAASPGTEVGGDTGLGMTNGTILQPLGPQGINSVPTHGVGTFKCEYPNCNAAPFHTQYLLNSHATVHSSNRPHYCPVQGCSRSINGQGFKRKNEMIRHQLVHESPGYVCPFCPEREHKYPRPDNLQRHVRVHHADVQPGDNRLRQVLERKVSGRGSGRRRKGVPY